MAVFDNVKFRMLVAGNGSRQSDLAKKLGVCQSTLVDWKKGHTQPSWKSLSKISKVLNVSVKELIKGE